MSETPQIYRKLPGRGAGILGITRLWLGDDHVLLVSSTFGVERYQRFYFRDIEAFVIRRTVVRLAWNLAFAGVGLLMVTLGTVIWMTAGIDGGNGAALGFISAFGLVSAACVGLILLNTLKGPTCAVSVQSAAGLTRLGAPTRLGNVRKVLQRLDPLIEAAQDHSYRGTADVYPARDFQTPATF